MSEALTGAAAIGAALLAVVALGLLLGAVVWLRALRRLVAQAQALQAGRIESAAEPAVAAATVPPGLRALARALDGIASRTRAAFEAHAHEVARLQARAHADAVTGLARREVFRAALDERLAAPLPSTLLLLRVAPLAALNDRVGHEATDALLAGTADVLRTYVERVPGSLAGRLNGCDFALWLPAGGVGAETGASLLQALAASPLAREAGAHYAIGVIDGIGTDGRRPDSAVGAALALADAALAEAEAVLAGQDRPVAALSLPPRTAMVVHAPDQVAAAVAGARAWREQLVSALKARRTRLHERPVRDAGGAEWHLACTLEVQLDAEAPWLAPRQWLALAARSRLLAEFDLCAVELALLAIARDGRPRAVRVGRSVLGTDVGRTALSALLQASPEAAWALVLELPESVLPGLDLAGTNGGTAEALARCRAAGVRLGAEHASAPSGALLAWAQADVQHLVLTAAAVEGVSTRDDLRAWVSALTALAQGLGLHVLVDGVPDPGELEALWALGIQAVGAEALSA